MDLKIYFLFSATLKLGKNPGIHGSQVEELTTSFDGREASTATTNSTGVRTNSLEATPAPERMLLGGREPQPQQQQQQQPSTTRPFVPLDSTFTQTIKLKLPPSPNPGGPSMAHSSRAQLPHCTLPRSRGHKEVTFNPQATFQVVFSLTIKSSENNDLNVKLIKFLFLGVQETKRLLRRWRAVVIKTW